MSKLSQKIAEKRANRAADRKPAPQPAAPAQQSPEELAAQVARFRRQLELAQQQSKQLLEAERARVKKAEQRAAQIEQERAAERLRASVLKSASAAGAIDPEDVTDLVLARYRLTTGPEGKIVREDDAAADLDTTIKTLLESKPHLARSTVASGTGSAPQARTSGPTAAPTKSFRESPNEALRAFALGAAAPAPAKSGPQH